MPGLSKLKDPGLAPIVVIVLAGVVAARLVVWLH